MIVSIELPEGDIQPLWNAAVKLANKNNVAIAGGISKGSLSAMGISADYKISDKILTVSANKVPFFITEKMVKKTIHEWVKQNS